VEIGRGGFCGKGGTNEMKAAFLFAGANCGEAELALQVRIAGVEAESAGIMGTGAVVMLQVVVSVGSDLGGECGTVAMSFGFGEGIESFGEAIESDERHGSEKPSNSEAWV